MKLVIISDTHEKHHQIDIPKDGDILIHCGDITMNGSLTALNDFAHCFKDQPQKHKIAISGNHDRCFENAYKDRAREILAENNIIYLQDNGIEIDGYKIYGSPWQPTFFDWSFNLPRGKALAEKWSQIPNDTNILICHTMPFGILDEVPRSVFDLEHVGCEELAKRIMQLKHLKLMCGGHLHHSYGVTKYNGITFAN